MNIKRNYIEADDSIKLINESENFENPVRF